VKGKGAKEPARKKGLGGVANGEGMGGGEAQERDQKGRAAEGCRSRHSQRRSEGPLRILDTKATSAQPKKNSGGWELGGDVVLPDEGKGKMHTPGEVRLIPGVPEMDPSGKKGFLKEGENICRGISIKTLGGGGDLWKGGGCPARLQKRV